MSDSAVDDSIFHFTAIVIIAYFGVKIFYGFFDIMPRKPTKLETLDLAATLALTMALFILTNMGGRGLLNIGTHDNITFMSGLMIGLSLPYLINSATSSNVYANSVVLQYILQLFVIGIAASIIYITAVSSSSLLSYITRLLIIILVVVGIIYTRQNGRLYSITKQKDGPDNSKIYTNGYVKTSGVNVSLSLGVVSWILCLLFYYKPEGNIQNDYLSVVNGLLFGAFVGSLAYNGVIYLLDDGSTFICTTEKECSDGGFIMNDVEYNNIRAQVITIQWIIAFMLALALVGIIGVYIYKASM